MRKTQVALAALALVASTAALAEVTAYGTVDASVVSNSNGTAFAGQGNSAGSIFGFKGSEDLGSGLKAGFNLESGLKLDTGATGGNGGDGASTFNRAANVSLSTEAVGITLGTQISPFITGMLTGSTAVGGNGAFVPGLFRVDGGSLATINQGSTAATASGGFFISDAVNVSVNGGGVGANVMYRMRGNGAAADGSEYTAANLTGSVSGINLALAYQDVKAFSASAGANPTTNATNVVLAGNTTIAGVRVNAAYGDNRGTTKSTGYLVGASMPLAGALSGGLTYSSNSKAGFGTQMTFSLQYDLSKATYGYLNYSSFSNTAGAQANDRGGLTAAKSLLAVGVAHSF
jgi:predicted porin